MIFPCILATCLIASADTSPDGSTPLLRSVYLDETDRAIELIQDGADVKQENRYGISPLYLACLNGNEPLVKALLEAGADPNAKRSGEPALMTAARTGKVGPIKALLHRGADVDSEGRNDQTALMWAAAEGHAEAARTLIEAGADPSRESKYGFTPMLFAARDGHVEVVAVLLEAGVDVGHAITTDKKIGKGPPRGSSALRLAVENGHFSLAIQLLEAGADPDDQRSGFAPLHALTWVRKPNRGDGNDGLPPPRGSGSTSSLEFARILVEDYGAGVDLRLKRGSKGGGRFGTLKATPFLMAARTADLPYLKVLHELGADPGLTNDDNTGALQAAAGVGSRAPEEEAGTEAERLQTLKWLLPLTGKLNARDRHGETAMHGAAYQNLPLVVQWLQEEGADIEVWNQKNRRGWTPLLIAQGFRPGNFKPSAATIAAIEKVMLDEGMTPPPAPERPVVGKPMKYEAP